MRSGTASHRAGGWDRAIRVAQLALLVVPLLLSGIPLGAYTTAASSAQGGTSTIALAGGSPLALPTETVTVRNQTTGNLSSFWGAGVNPGYSLANLSSETKGTPVNWVVWPAGDVADSFDMTNGTVWTDGVPSADLTNESQFVAACEAIACHAILTVPGENDNPWFAAYEVAYTEQVLHFHPAYWEVGNEPSRWLHFGKNWQQWNYTDFSNATPSTYAHEVHAYIAAMKAVDPSIRIIGLPGVGHGFRPDWPWLDPTIQLNGPNLSAVAIHVYPAGNGPPTASVPQFFATLTNPATNVVTRIVEDQKAVAAEETNISCTTCSIQFLVDEFGAGTRLSNWQPYMHSYAEIPYIAAELLMMSETNVSNADLFELRSGYNGSLFNGVGLPFPLDSLYDQILPHYDPIPLTTTVAGTQKGVFAGASESAGSNSLTLLAVNANTTQGVQVNVAGNVFPRGGTYEVWRESNSTQFPNGSVSQSFGFQLTPSWVVPPLGVILVSVCRSNASVGAGGLYPLTFCESGLPAGTPWSVTAGGSTLWSTTGTVTFSERNGSTSYQIGSVPGWSTLNTSGTAMVDGAPSAIQVPWTRVTYPVRFQESFLPSGTNWSVNLSGTWSRSNTSTITGYEPNGTFGYTYGIVPGWRPLVASGSVLVNAAPAAVSVSWTQVTYLVTFHQSGLPARTNWSIDLAGSREYNATGAPIRFLEPNGTYAYTVGPIAGYTPDATSGSVLVEGYPRFEPLTFAKDSSVYPIEFSTTGLPAGTSWAVTLNGTQTSGPDASFTFYEPNGTYPYSLSGAANWTPLAYAGIVNVIGAAVFVVVPYTQLTYNVTFNETGLPDPMPAGGWSVTLNGTPRTSTTASLSFQEPNGTYAYEIGGEPGYTTSPWRSLVTVYGNSTSLTVRWSIFLSTVTFTELGLRSAGGVTTWTLNVTGQDPVVNYLNDPPYGEGFANGTYSFTATTSVPGMVLVPAEGNFTVIGEPVSIFLHFASVYSVTFVASGLPPSTNWSMDLNGSLLATIGSTIQYAEPNGTYLFQVPTVTGYIVAPLSGGLTVAGANVQQTLTFSRLPPGTYAVTFSEMGLSVATNWSVTLNAVLGSSTGDSMSFPEPNGTFPYHVGDVPGYRIMANSTGNVTVNGAGASVTVLFAVFVATSPVTFREGGLPTDTNWSLSLNGAPPVTSNGTTITLREPNGTYAYRLGIVPGWTTTNFTGSITVPAVGTIVVHWTQKLYSVTLTETGMPLGDVWSVSLNGTPAVTTNSSALSFREPNGSYPFSVQLPPGFTSAQAFGTVQVQGGFAHVAITVTATARGASAPSFLTVGQAAALAGVGIVVALVAFWWVRGRKRSAPPPPP